MGLLTDPNAQPEGLSKLLLKCHAYLSVVCYSVGIVWFMILSSEQFNAETYISENALLPAMVEREFNLHSDTLNYLTSLKEEMDRYQNEMPTAWLQGQFRQLGLEVHLHNFTLKYPFSEHTSYEGRNVYAILRAPRAASTEALVLCAPFRSPVAVHPDTSPGIALMFALAKFFRQRSFWAKDIIFLITEHEQLGVKAWLEAYHGVGTSDQVLDSGVLPSRSGIIQAAVNLEIHDKLTRSVDLKIEGLTGQLPNLDLFNLAIRLCLKENVHVTFKNRGKSGKPDTFQGWLHDFQTTMSMVNSQATGTPTGNHGLFLRYNIDALTLEGHPKRGKMATPINQIGRVVEGIFRSLNNLLESLHQSYFFYLLPGPDRYVSIGLYMPPLGLILLPVVLHIVKLQIEIQRDLYKRSAQETVSYSLLLVCMVTAHLAGLGLFMAPKALVYLGHSLFHLTTENSLFFGTLLVFISSLFLPVFMCRFFGRTDENVWKALKMVTLLEATLLIATVSLANYSLALVVSVVIVPFIVTTTPPLSRWRTWLKSVLLLLISPIGLALLSVVYDTTTTYPEVGLGNLLDRTLAASKRVLLFAVTDGYIYNNWMFLVASVFYFPTWIQLWCTQHVSIKIKQD